MTSRLWNALTDALVLQRCIFLKHVAQRCKKPDSETMLGLLHFLDLVPLWCCFGLLLTIIVLNKKKQPFRFILGVLGSQKNQKMF